MKCGSCGLDNNAAAKFCERCGAPIQPSAPPRPNAPPNNGGQNMPRTNSRATKAFPLKTILFIAVPAIVVVLLIVILVPMLFSGNKYATVSDSIDVFSSNGVTLISANNSMVTTIDDGMETYGISLDGKYGFIQTEDSTLYYVTTGEKRKVADDISEPRMADSGAAVLYLTDVSDGSGTLNIYDAWGQKPRKIADDVKSESFVISPDGQTVAYAANWEDDDFDTYMVFGSGAPVKQDGKLMPRAISNGGNYFYFNKGENLDAFYVKSGDTETKLASTKVYFFRLNADYSQIMFETDSKTYLSINGAEKAKIANGSLRAPLVTSKGQYVYNQNYVTHGISSFLNTLVGIDEDVYYIQSNLDTNKISRVNSANYSSDGMFGMVCDDMRTLIYMDSSENLITVDASNPNAEKKQLAKSIKRYQASSDGRIVYYINDDDELMYVYGSGGDPVKIADDVTHIAMMPGGYRIYFLADYSNGSGILYFSDNGGQKTKVDKGGEVSGIKATNLSIYYQIRTDDQGDFELYRSSGGENFTQIYKP